MSQIPIHSIPPMELVSNVYLSVSPVASGIELIATTSDMSGKTSEQRRVIPTIDIASIQKGRRTGRIHNVYVDLKSGEVIHLFLFVKDYHTLKSWNPGI